MCHNGEINTVRGNVNWMHARQAVLASDRFGDLRRLFPIVTPNGSDSSSLDNVIEFLTLGGRELPHVMAMLMPEAWDQDSAMDPAKKAFYEYHASLMEPWDGPAAVAFTDGRLIGSSWLLKLACFRSSPKTSKKRAASSPARCSLQTSAQGASSPTRK
jgi:glutamate synthase domain-containing protein 1